MFNTRRRTPWRSLLPRNSPRAPSRDSSIHDPSSSLPTAALSSRSGPADGHPSAFWASYRTRHRSHSKPATGATAWQLPHNTPADASRFRKANGHRHQADGHWVQPPLSFTVNAPRGPEHHFRPVGPLLADRQRRPCHIWPSCHAALFAVCPGTERPGPGCRSLAAARRQ